LFTFSVSQPAIFSLDEEYSPDEAQALLVPLQPDEAQALLVPLAPDEAQALLALLVPDEAQALPVPLVPYEAQALLVPLVLGERRCSQVLQSFCSLLTERLREFQPYKVLPPAWLPLPHDR
jgi:hypothetical protein